MGFKPNLDTARINDAIDRIREKIKKEYGLMRLVIIQPEVFEEKVDPDVQRYI